ncbi:Biopolymer transport protein ExbD/TolR [Pirellulimonas nuda]|uniref:Biopolymer transport protein ExbD/TolR n=1 Tax=Pirellulimonas nuda TaxID=2528009 RepID=A0A518D784_9BACT|nr:biopolymer transporter ExbD [Pirellulimonas nuda]QDU87299.1 Biopolymer transport protein ExbD/TolR [Pirellulimonas nuda]
MRTSFPRKRPPATDLAAVMTPMIDVVFLLLIFFLCTSSFQRPEKTLPASLLMASDGASDLSVEPEPELERVTLAARVGASGTRWLVNERPAASLADATALLRTLAEIDPSLPVTIDAASEVPMGDLVDGYDAGRLAGFTKVQIAAGE